MSSSPFHCVVVMGVSGCGKSSVGSALAALLGPKTKFIDGDDLHPRANIVKMSSGTPLDDEDRGPWLERLNDVAFSLAHKNERGVVACSALKRRYRDRLRLDNTGLLFLYLRCSHDVVQARLQARSNHYMPTTLLKSQFEALEEPGEDEREDVVTVDVDGLGTVEEVARRGLELLCNKRV